MKHYGLLVATAMVGIVMSGCATSQGKIDNTATGAAGVDLAGGALGHSVDQARDAQEVQQKAKIVPPQSRWQRESPPPPVTKEDVIAMTRAKAGDAVIISHIRNSGTVFQLKTADIVALKKARVSDQVIDFMLNTPNEIRAAAVVGVPTAAPPPSIGERVVISPGPGYYWVDGDWLWINGGWSWRQGYWHPPYGYHYGHGRRW